MCQNNGSKAILHLQTRFEQLADSLRAYNTYLRETAVVAEKLKSDPASDIAEDKAKLEQYLTQAQDALAASNDSRPA